MSNKGNTAIWVVVALVVVGILGYFAFTQMGSPTEEESIGSALDLSDESPTPGEDEFIDEEFPGQELGVTAEAILESPELYIGQPVTVRGEVEEGLAPNAFLLDTPGIVGDSLLVITAEPVSLGEDDDLITDDVWEITGVVETFAMATFSTDPEFDFDADTFDAYEGSPYIMATSVARMTSDEDLDATASPILEASPTVAPGL